MSIREVTMYQVECSAPGCTVNTKDFDDHWAWTESSHAEEYWDNGDGITTDAGEHYCLKHWAWCVGCESEQIPSYEGAADKCAACSKARP